MDQSVSLTINGEAHLMPEGSTIKDALCLLGLQGGKVAVEHNRAIAPRSQFAEIPLQTGDALEIVRFVGGG